MSSALVLWSGGVESTSLLKHLLETSDMRIVAHHIERENPEKRMTKERRAIHALQPHLRKIRDFTLSYSSISICDGEAFPMDYSVDYPIGIIAMYHHRCHHIYRAGCAEDDWDHQGHPDGSITVTLPHPEPGFSHVRRAETLKPLLRCGRDPAVVAPWLTYYAKPKAEHVKYLGELAKLTWSCRKPVNGKECGKCHSCLELNAARKGRSWIPAIDATLC